MEKFENLLTRHKSDFERVEKNMDRNKILPLLPGLLEWTKDINWPIAPSVMELQSDNVNV
ncbi:DUF5071 domain-containing protein [Paenisporosarcina macmurdoensis]|uniref:DUF5071 domain-containing protein n=1 Tax=Paenisporosarcina macmurdoensis TaxID=212659 RepID=A0ABW1L948_9BACL